MLVARSKCTRLPAPVAEAATVRGCQRRAFADTGKRRQHGLHGLERGEQGVLRTEHETALPTRNFTKMPHASELRQSAKSDVRSVCQRCAVTNASQRDAAGTVLASGAGETLRVRYWTAGRGNLRSAARAEALLPESESLHAGQMLIGIRATSRGAS